MACASSINDAIRIATKPRRLVYLVVGKADNVSFVRITKKQAAWLLGRGVLTDKPGFAYSVHDIGQPSEELRIYENC